MFSVSGLVRKKEYNILIRAVSSDRYRYKYIHNTWSQVSESEYSHDHNKMEAQHPSSPQTGAKWMAKDVDFKSVKITHYPKSKGGDVSHTHTHTLSLSHMHTLSLSLTHTLITILFFSADSSEHNAQVLL